ncbi:MAG: PQQ-dependent sugar dehydrogenase, partial [Chloroflexota bacterium]
MKPTIAAIALVAIFVCGLAVAQASVNQTNNRDNDSIFFFPIVTNYARNLVLELELVDDGLPTVTNLTHSGDGRRFASLRDGRIFLIEADNTVNQVPYLDMSERMADVYWEQGLLGLAFHPDFLTNGHFYVYYTPNDSGESVAPGVLARFTTDPTSDGPV